MYIPKHFAERRTSVLFETIRRYPLGTLVTLGESGLTANHMPFVVVAGPDGSNTLQGHVARANPVWRDMRDDREALVIFGGPQHYISPSWYRSKPLHGKVVPTWNYVVVHVYGKIRVVTDRDWLLENVSALTHLQEAEFEDPWQISDAPPDFIEKMLGVIVGIEVKVQRIEGKSKLSQNRSRDDRAGVVTALQSRQSGTPLAEYMIDNEILDGVES